MGAITYEQVYNYVLTLYYKDNQFRGIQELDKNRGLASFLFYRDKEYPDMSGVTTEVYNEYKKWAQDRSLPYLSKAMFTKELQADNIFIRQTHRDGKQVRLYERFLACPTCEREF